MLNIKIQSDLYILLTINSKSYNFNFNSTFIKVRTSILPEFHVRKESTQDLNTVLIKFTTTSFNLNITQLGITWQFWSNL